MNLRSRVQLIRQIAHLVKQNKELLEKLKRIEKEIDTLMSDNERYRLSLEKHKLSLTGVETEEKTLKFNMVTVLFADIHGFARLMEESDSSVIIDELDEIRCEFDNIVNKYHIQKIKTIGDSFMCAGGIPEKNITNPVDVVMAAIEMRRYLNQYEGNRKEGSKIWELKIGIHTGPVTASIAGKKKSSYDIKGETVNTASRLEAVSKESDILISAMTYELVKEFFDCEYYGRLPVKYTGELPMYRVAGILPEYSVEGRGILPNDSFKTKVKLIQFTDIQEIILDKLEKELPASLYYHNVKHTVDVVTEVELIGWAEGCSDEEILLLKTAGLFHDIGFITGYDDHEYNSTLIARAMLPAYDYSQEQIDEICRLIISTRLTPKPEGLLEEIICDSDLDYLGRNDFIPVSNTLFEELKSQNKITSLNDWNKLQVKFITGHQYFTSTARSLREVNKQSQIERISSLIVND